MAVIKMKPTSPGRRGVVKISREHLHKGAPHAAWNHNSNKLDVITTVTSQHAIKVVVISITIAWWISVVTKMAFLQK